MAKFKEYAPGVSIESEHEYGVRYMGRAPALVASGLVKREWLPGETGNGKTSQRIAFNQDGSPRRLTLAARIGAKDEEFGYLSIHKSGGIFRVVKVVAVAEIETRKAAYKAKAEQETWNLAKEAHRNQDLPERWKQGVLYYINKAKELIDGRAVFQDFPDIGLNSADADACKNAIDVLNGSLSRAVPRVKDTVRESNVVSFSDFALRGMRKASA